MSSVAEMLIESKLRSDWCSCGGNKNMERSEKAEVCPIER